MSMSQADMRAVCDLAMLLLQVMDAMQLGPPDASDQRDLCSQLVRDLGTLQCQPPVQPAASQGTLTSAATAAPVRHDPSPRNASMACCRLP